MQIDEMETLSLPLFSLTRLLFARDKWKFSCVWQIVCWEKQCKIMYEYEIMQNRIDVLARMLFHHTGNISHSILKRAETLLSIRLQQ